MRKVNTWANMGVMIANTDKVLDLAARHNISPDFIAAFLLMDPEFKVEKLLEPYDALSSSSVLAGWPKGLQDFIKRIPEVVPGTDYRLDSILHQEIPSGEKIRFTDETVPPGMSEAMQRWRASAEMWLAESQKNLPDAGDVPIVPQQPSPTVRDAFALFYMNLFRDEGATRPEVLEGRYYKLPLTDGSYVKMDMYPQLVGDGAGSTTTDPEIQMTLSFDYQKYTQFTEKKE